MGRHPWAHTGRSGVAQLLSLSPSPGCSPLAAGLLGGGTVAVAVWQCQPCCARAQMLAAAPLPGLPSGLSSLVTGPCFDPRSQDPTNPGCAGEKRDTELAQRALALRPAAAWQRGSSTAWHTLPTLPSSLWLSSTPPRIFGSGICCLESLPAMLEMAPGVPGSSRWAHGPGTKLLLKLGIDGTCTHTGRVSPVLPHPLIPCSPGGMGAAGWTPRFLMPGGR